MEIVVSDEDGNKDWDAWQRLLTNHKFDQRRNTDYEEIQRIKLNRSVLDVVGLMMIDMLSLYNILICLK